MSTTIQWTNETWNPIRARHKETGRLGWHCTKPSIGCKNCYAEAMNQWRGTGLPFVPASREKIELFLDPKALAKPLRWKKARKIFVCDMTDLFLEDVPDEFITAVFGIMAAAPQHTFQLLTKRPERMRAWFEMIANQGGLGPYIRSIRIDGDRTLPNLFNAVARTEVIRGKRRRAIDDPWMQVFNAAACIGSGHLHNVWLGVSVENQATADERIPILLRTPAAVRWISAEPLLGQLDLDDEWLLPNFAADDDRYNHPGGRGLDWVVVGGESGVAARPCDLQWIRVIAAQCMAADVPVFVKQLGALWYDEASRKGIRGSCLIPIDGGLPWEWVKQEDRKGGDPQEWPEDLRVREFPR